VSVRGVVGDEHDSQIVALKHSDVLRVESILTTVVERPIDPDGLFRAWLTRRTCYICSNRGELGWQLAET